MLILTLFKEGGEGEGGLMGQTATFCRAGWSPLEWVKYGGFTLWVFLVTMLLGFVWYRGGTMAGVEVEDAMGQAADLAD